MISTASDQVRHQVWADRSEIRNRDISHIFSDISRLYIADGHHRAASAVKAGLRKRAENPDFSGR